MDLIYRDSGIRRWLAHSNSVSVSLYLGLTAFCLYSCVYAFRKSFSVAVFDGVRFLGIDYKIWLVTFQVMGYAASKFFGIKIISELKASSRTAGILITVVVAGLSWFFFAITPRPFNLIFLFTNGFPLGLVWGMVFGFLEGRRDTDALGAGMAISFIFSAGLCKSAGAFVMRDWHVSETWMPFITALLFTGPLLLFLWLLDQAPPPTAHDEQLRTRRQPMGKKERIVFLRTFALGLLFIIILYALLTAFRDFRDNFAAEIWQSLGMGNSPEIFTITEIPISIACLILIGSLVLIRNNFKALIAIHALIFIGMILITSATYAFGRGWLAPTYWMTLVGFGLYLGYIPFNSSFFDRMLGAFRISGTVGFVMYLADSIGYLASIGVLFYKQFAQPHLSWLEFFTAGAYVLSGAGMVMVLASLIYFTRKNRLLISGQ